ncbi:MAG: sodium/proline symporter [Lentisphaerae bacterium]|nr:sodium/proline symporter [Lentisphaerota bacterium]
MKIAELAALLCYFALVLYVGIYFFWKDRKGNNGEKAYFLGGRQMNGWVSALSAGASDMSAWVLMGLPGSIYLYGVGQLWIAIGLLLGTIIAWIWVAPALRRYSIAANDAITVPQFLTRRFCTERKGIMTISAVVFVITYCVYTASSLYACGTLFNTVIGMQPQTAMLIASVVIVFYTLLGGFNAVCWTDFFQGMLMLGALMLVPILTVAMMNSTGFVQPQFSIPASYYNILSSGKMDWKSASDIISGLGWGLGYFGMPHILIRYFSVKSEKEMRKSQIIGCSWLFLILLATSIVGLLGRRFLGDTLTTTKDGNTLVFINMVRNVFAWIGDSASIVMIASFAAGILLSAILAASMSTADSQLLASASAFASDLYKPIFRKNASGKEMMWAGRVIVFVIAIVAYFIASNPSCQGIMGLVSCAWAAFGAAFGPVILLALYWKRMTYNGALAGIIVGFVVDALWYMFMGWTMIYEIIPGFAAGAIATVVVSLLSAQPDKVVIDLFDRSRQPIENNLNDTAVAVEEK